MRTSFAPQSQRCETGSGDYTAERWQWLPADVDVETLARMIEQQKTSKQEQQGS